MRKPRSLIAATVLAILLNCSYVKADDMVLNQGSSKQTLVVSFLPDKSELEDLEKINLNKSLSQFIKPNSCADIYTYGSQPDSNQSVIRRLALERGLNIKALLQDEGMAERQINILPLGEPDDAGQYDKAKIILYQRP